MNLGNPFTYAANNPASLSCASAYCPFCGGCGGMHLPDCPLLQQDPPGTNAPSGGLSKEELARLIKEIEEHLGPLARDESWPTKPLPPGPAPERLFFPVYSRNGPAPALPPRRKYCTCVQFMLFGGVFTCSWEVPDGTDCSKFCRQQASDDGFDGYKTDAATQEKIRKWKDKLREELEDWH